MFLLDTSNRVLLFYFYYFYFILIKCGCYLAGLWVLGCSHHDLTHTTQPQSCRLTVNLSACLARIRCYAANCVNYSKPFPKPFSFPWPLCPLICFPAILFPQLSKLHETGFNPRSHHLTNHLSHHHHATKISPPLTRPLYYSPSKYRDITITGTNSLVSSPQTTRPKSGRSTTTPTKNTIVFSNHLLSSLLHPNPPLCHTRRLSRICSHSRPHLTRSLAKNWQKIQPRPLCNLRPSSRCSPLLRLDRRPAPPV